MFTFKHHEFRPSLRVSVVYDEIADEQVQLCDAAFWVTAVVYAQATGNHVIHLCQLSESRKIVYFSVAVLQLNCSFYFSFKFIDSWTYLLKKNFIQLIRSSGVLNFWKLKYTCMETLRLSLNLQTKLKIIINSSQ